MFLKIAKNAIRFSIKRRNPLEWASETNYYERVKRLNFFSCGKTSIMYFCSEQYSQYINRRKFYFEPNCWKSFESFISLNRILVHEMNNWDITENLLAKNHKTDCICSCSEFFLGKYKPFALLLLHLLQVSEARELDLHVYHKVFQNQRANSS